MACAVVLAVCLPAPAAFAQDPADPAAPSLTRFKQRLDRPTARPLKPSQPIQLRPTFRSRATDRPWVPTLEEHLYKTFELTDFQRQYAKYAASCCGIDLGAVFGGIERALAERRQRKVSAEVARELAEVEAAAARARAVR